MATITRGYNFSPTEQVTARKLDELIRNATVTGIHWSEYGGAIISISTFSAPPSASVGWIDCRYETVLTAASLAFLQPTQYSGWSEFNYVLKSPTGDVAVFKQFGLESRRFVSRGISGGVHLLGHHLTPNTGNGNVTLAVAFEVGSQAFGNAHCIGANSYFTATTSPTDPSGAPRIVIHGLCNFKTTAPNDTLNRYLFADNDAAGRFGCTSSSSMDKALGVALTGAAGERVFPGLLWGGPVWRI